MILWSVLTETLGNAQFCWMPFTESDFLYILVGPMGFALIVPSLLPPLDLCVLNDAVQMNFLFLLTVIGILVQKLRAESTAESQRIWLVLSYCCKGMLAALRMSLEENDQGDDPLSAPAWSCQHPALLRAGGARIGDLAQHLPTHLRHPTALTGQPEDSTKRRAQKFRFSFYTAGNQK